MTDYTPTQLRALDAAVAEARGWTRPGHVPHVPIIGCFRSSEPPLPCPYWHPPLPAREWLKERELPRPTESIADAMELVEGFAYWDCYGGTDASAGGVVAFLRHGMDENGCDAVAPTLSLALTLAYLRAQGLDPDAIVKGGER